MIDGYFNILVYVQPFFFILLYHLKWNPVKLKRFFPYIWFFFYSVIMPFLILMLPFTLYNTYLMLFYGTSILMVYVEMAEIRKKDFSKSLSLAFLITFLSSFFWEFPMHLMDLIENGLTGNLLLQCLHLTPLIVLTSHFKIVDKVKLFRYCMLSFSITSFMTFLRFIYLVETVFNSPLIYLNRGMCLLILFKIFFNGKILMEKPLKQCMNNV